MKKTAAARAKPAALALPPYGHMHEGFRESMKLAPVPEGFRVRGKPASVDDYDRYIDEESSAMADFIWPRYDFAKSAWVGKAIQHAEELTRADFELMNSLCKRLQEEVIVPERKLGDRVLSSALRLGKSQHGLFRLEDTSARGTIDLYLEGVKEDAPELLEAMKRSVSTGFARLGAATLRFKQEFQRPRPYQVAFMYARDFPYEYGATAVTPALVSGHCMQGLFVRSYATLANRVQLAQHLGAIDAMQQYCIEIGDRRVYAGVHYPSDNISSWYGCLRLCHHSFDGMGQEAKDFMWDAIKGSAVYKELQTAAAGAHAVYKPMLQALEAEAGRRVA